jgi:hypothetical protein
MSSEVLIVSRARAVCSLGIGSIILGEEAKAYGGRLKYVG